MERGGYSFKSLLWIGLICGIVILAFVIGKSQERVYQDYGVKTALSQEVISSQNTFAGVAEEVKPSVVSIYTEQMLKQVAPFNFFFSDPFNDFFNDFFGQQAPKKNAPQAPQNRYYNQRIEGAGSGVIIDKDGYILTNYHVVKDAEKINVKLSDDKEYSGKVIGKDAKTDLAVIKINPSGTLTVAKLGDSDKIRVGDWVLAFGSPFGLEQTVTHGIISAKRQNIEAEGTNYRDVIQTDAPINRGNSGGPLVNMYGEVIGINTLIFSQTGGSMGVGFAIPINRAKEILTTLETKGKVDRGFLGISPGKVDDVIALQSGLKEKTGVLVAEVIGGFAADKAGIKRGDIILEFGGKKIESVEQFQDVVAATPPSTKVDVVVWRDNSRKIISVMLGEWTEENAGSANEMQPGKEGKTASWMGMKVKQFTKDMADELSISPDEQGVVITEIEDGSKAAEMGLYAGDLIRAINKQKTTTIPEFEAATKKVSLAQGVMFDINRGGNLIFKTYMEK